MPVPPPNHPRQHQAELHRKVVLRYHMAMSLSQPSADSLPIWRRIEPHERAMMEEIRRLKAEKNALILAHNYQLPAIQDVADYVGDSLGLARVARDADAERIVFCGVYFMAETAKILNPDRKVLIPDPNAGCSLVDSINAEKVREWKAQHPGAVVVGYVNTSAEVKAELDYCCTSANAVAVVQAIPADTEVLFLPDMFLGSYVQAKTGRKNMHIWAGECHVHAAIRPETIAAAVAAHPGADLLVHPECGCSTTCMFLAAKGDINAATHILSTSGMIEHATKSSQRQFLVATEVGILHQLEAQAPDKSFVPVSERAVCEYMKMITSEKLLETLRHDRFEVNVPPEIAQRALKAIERMVAIG